MQRLAVIGDIHGCWTAEDVRWIDAAGYDLVVFVGDLAGYRQSETVRIARLIAALQTPALILPGNHDAVHALQMLSEVLGRPSLTRALVSGQGRRHQALADALPGRHRLAGYSHHPLSAEVAIIAARPQSIGGPRMAFVPHLTRRFRVSTMAESAARLCELVRRAPEPSLIFLAHNGPTGLGSTRDAIWGCDFKAQAGDWGDPDLRTAIDFAVEQGRTVLAVLAGHMHRRLKGGGQRQASQTVDGIAYLNAAEVPRIRDGRHHHVAVTIAGGAAVFEERWLNS